MFETPEALIIGAILFVIVLLLLTVLVFVLYSGLLTNISVKAGTAPIGAVTIAYKYVKGPYSNASSHFTELVRVAPHNRTLGIYYDDPRAVAEDQLRYVVATILCEGASTEVPEGEKQAVLSAGFQIMSLPSISYTVKCTFPYKSFLSLYFAIARVYPRIDEFIKHHKLCAHPMIEIYSGDVIHFMAPLSHQEEFYVHEVAPVSPVVASDTSQASVSQSSASQSSTVSSSSSQAMTQCDSGINLTSPLCIKSKTLSKLSFTLPDTPLIVTEPPTTSELKSGSQSTSVSSEYSSSSDQTTTSLQPPSPISIDTKQIYALSPDMAMTGSQGTSLSASTDSSPNSESSFDELVDVEN